MAWSVNTVVNASLIRGTWTPDTKEFKMLQHVQQISLFPKGINWPFDLMHFKKKKKNANNKKKAIGTESYKSFLSIEICSTLSSQPLLDSLDLLSPSLLFSSSVLFTTDLSTSCCTCPSVIPSGHTLFRSPLSSPAVSLYLNLAEIVLKTI